MGVSRENKDLFTYDYTSDELEVISSSEDSNSERDDSVQNKKRQNQKNRTKGRLAEMEETGSRRKYIGAKQSRRCENLHYLLGLVDNEEYGNLQFNNFIEPSVSAFTELLQEREKMQIWNDFVNCSEDDQNAILQEAHSHHHKMCDSAVMTESDDVALDDTWEEIPDKRAGHPSFSADECFKRLDAQLRHILTRRQKPMGLLLFLEDDIVPFFTDWPTSVYVSHMTSSYERLLLHSLCQYLDLKSHSHDESGKRQTLVENNHDYFSPPSPLLTQYLTRLSRIHMQ